jgi:hypothetical protein
MIRHCKWPLKELEQTYDERRKEAKEARRQLYATSPVQNPTMFYYTERCILKEDAHTRGSTVSSYVPETSRQRASEYKEYSSALKFDSQKTLY